MRIIVDIMGGDKAPAETLKGVVWAAAEYNASFTLVGDKNEIEKLAVENKYDLSGMEIVHTEVVITMEDDPMKVIRGKQDSSMSVGLKMLAEGKGDAFVSTGNTGALFTGATLLVRKLKGIQRPGIGAILPMQKPVLLMDTGANVTVTEENLEQFGVMGSAYMRMMYGIEKPRVLCLHWRSESLCTSAAFPRWKRPTAPRWTKPPPFSAIFSAKRSATFFANSPATAPL